jgi:TolA-binding protein
METFNSESVGARGAQPRSTVRNSEGCRERRVRGRRLAWIVSLLMAVIQPAFAQEPANSSDPAARAMAEGVPEVAAARLRASLANPLPDEEWQTSAMRLAEALIAANQPADALTLLGDRRFAATVVTKFWRAQALAGMQRWSEALPLYQAVAAAPGSPRRAEAIFGEAEMFRALGRTNEALQALAGLMEEREWKIPAQLRSTELFLDKSDRGNARRLLEEMKPTTVADRREARFLRARLELARNRPERALGTFESLVKKPEGAGHALVLGALLGVADAHLQLKTPETGDDFLEDFIDRHPLDPELPKIFAKLDELYRAERKPARIELEKWTRESEQPRRTLAQWYLARIELRAGHRDRALHLLGELRKSGAALPESAPALLEDAELQFEEGRFEEAIALLEEARALQPEAALLDRTNLLSGESHYAAGQFQPAADRFEQVAHSGSPFATTATFNASLGWLQLGDQTRFLAMANELEARGADESTRAELRLEQGLVQAAKGDRSATDTLQKFLRDFPQSPRASEAWVALAELAFHATPPRLEEARKDLVKAQQAHPTPGAMERSDYLSIWIEDSVPGNDSNLIERAIQFLGHYPDSTFSADVRMKLAEAYYRRQDFANAQTQFENLAQQNPSGPVVEKALFFAAESAMSTMGPHSLDRAIELFDRVVQLKGDLRWAARNEQAVIERKLGRPQEALLLYDEVLKNEARPVEKREALCGRGDIFLEMGAEDPKNYERAIQAYEQLAADKNEPGHWRNQALFKKGVCLEKKADRDAALTTFFQVLEGQTRPDRPSEFFWFYKAGFNAARLLEDAAKWESAAAVYEKLAAAGGTRSEEAQGRLSRLRLEHFLWQN